MPAYTINNSRGNLVATINVGTTTGALFPIELVGQGISLYGPTIATSQFHLLEHFANTVEPSNPVEGMIWYKVGGVPHYFNDVRFIPLLGQTTSHAAQFEMLPSASNIDFTTTGTVPLFTAPGDGTSWHPTALLLIPTAVNDVTNGPQFNLFVTSSEDVMENNVIPQPSPERHAFFSIEGTTAFADNVDTISLDISIAALGGGSLELKYDAFLFGYNKD